MNVQSTLEEFEALCSPTVRNNFLTTPEDREMFDLRQDPDYKL
jgi:hypothetical protein